MAMDPLKRAKLEADLLDHMRRTRSINVETIVNGKPVEYVAARSYIQGEMVYFAAMDEGPDEIFVFKMNAVAAVAMAIHVLEIAQSLFPDSVELNVQLTPPRLKQH